MERAEPLTERRARLVSRLNGSVLSGPRRAVQKRRNKYADSAGVTLRGIVDPITRKIAHVCRGKNCFPSSRQSCVCGVAVVRRIANDPGFSCH